MIAPDLWRSLELVDAVEAVTVASVGSAVRVCHGDVKLGFCVAAERVDRMRPYVWATKRVGCVVPGDCPQSQVIVRLGVWLTPQGTPTANRS